MDLGLNSIIAKTSAQLAKGDGVAGNASAAAAAATSPTTSATTLAPDGAALLTEAATVAVSPSQKQQRRSPAEKVDEAAVEGSLADWKFSGNQNDDASPSPARPQTHQKKSRSTPNLRRGGKSKLKSPSSSGKKLNKVRLPSHRSSQTKRGTRPSTVNELLKPQHGLGNVKLSMSPFGIRAKSQIPEAERLAGDGEAFDTWIRKSGVQRATTRLGLELEDLFPRSRASFAREPGRPHSVSYQVQELRYSHFLLRRIEKIALVLDELAREKKKSAEDYAAQARGERVRGAKALKDVSTLFERTVGTERRRLAKLDKKRAKVTKVLDVDNQLLLKRRRAFAKKAALEKKRQEVVARRKEIQMRHLAARAEKRNRESKRTRALVKKRHDDALLKAAEDMRRRERESVEKKRLMDLAKKKENNKADLVAKKREEIKERARAVVEQRRIESDKKAAAAKRQMDRIRKKKEDERAAQRELKALHSRDREEMVRRQRQARLHEQDKAQEHHEKWLQRTALLSEIETAVRHERQLHQKEHIIQEWHRKKNTVYQRDLLPGPGEYQLRDTWKSPSKGATKISDANPKSDVDWAIHFAKQLPGPGEVCGVLCCMVIRPHILCYFVDILVSPNFIFILQITHTDLGFI